MAKKVTLKDLIGNKDNIQGRREETRELFIKSLDGVITIKKPNRQLCLDAIDMEDSMNADVFVVYNCVIEPNLKDTELHKAYGVVEPDEIVTTIFEPGEISNISRECLVLAGYSNSVEIVDDIKN